MSLYEDLFVNREFFIVKSRERGRLSKREKADDQKARSTDNGNCAFSANNTHIDKRLGNREMWKCMSSCFCSFPIDLTRFLFENNKLSETNILTTIKMSTSLSLTFCMLEKQKVLKDNDFGLLCKDSIRKLFNWMPLTNLMDIFRFTVFATTLDIFTENYITSLQLARFLNRNKWIFSQTNVLSM